MYIAKTEISTIFIILSTRLFSSHSYSQKYINAKTKKHNVYLLMGSRPLPRAWEGGLSPTSVGIWISKSLGTL